MMKETMADNAEHNVSSPANGAQPMEAENKSIIIQSELHLHAAPVQKPQYERQPLYPEEKATWNAQLRCFLASSNQSEYKNLEKGDKSAAQLFCCSERFPFLIFTPFIHWPILSIAATIRAGGALYVHFGLLFLQQRCLSSYLGFTRISL